MFNDGGGATKQKQYTTAGSRTVQVRVTDSHGGQDTDQVVRDAGATQLRSLVTFLTRRDGLEVKVDGKTRLDGWARRFAVGASVKVTAPKRQWRDGELYEFVRWSDDGARVHSFLVPEGRWRLRAIYRIA